jgi:hypothetical protein
MKTLFIAGLLFTVASIIIVRATDTPQPEPQPAFIISCVGKPTLTLGQLTHTAVSEDKAAAANAIRELRARGPEGLRALLDTHAEMLKAHTGATILSATRSPDESWLRLKSALDGVGQQRDCYTSRLYWYTDFEQAKAAARAGAKPILSLRLLGKLDEEFSCANSRFFRTTLYANSEVARYLNENFVLHWKSVRPVPKLTIDFGDGRTLERTITGNSIHYILDAEGRVIDALPGLYGPKAFLRELTRAGEVARGSGALSGEARETFLREFHRSRLAALNDEFAIALAKTSATPPVQTVTDKTPILAVVNETPSAGAAGVRATAKGRVEMPILKRSTPGQAATDVNEDLWKRIAALHVEDAKLDEGARRLIMAKNPAATTASRLAVTKTRSEDPLLRQIRNLERSIAEDTVRNEYLFHTQIHDWLATGSAPADIDGLNQKVYAELFLTPDSDPWLGLLPNDAYAALENDGITLTKNTEPPTTTNLPK